MIFLGGRATHNRTWTDNQNSLNTLFTSEEYRMVLDKAREEADGFTRKALAACYRLQQAHWYQQRILTGMGMLGFKLNTVDIAFLQDYDKGHQNKEALIKFRT